MKKSLYKELCLLLPLSGIIVLIISFFIPLLTASVSINDTITDSFSYSIWEIVFANKDKAFYTDISIIFFIGFILNIILSIATNLLIHFEEDSIIAVLTGIVGIIINFISMILLYIMSWNVEMNIIELNYNIYPMHIDVENNDFLKILFFMEFVGLGISYGSSLFQVKNAYKSPDETIIVFKNEVIIDEYYRKLFFISLIIYLAIPLLLIVVLIVVLLLVLKIPIRSGKNSSGQKKIYKSKIYISSDKKSVIIDDKKYVLRGEDVYDDKNNHIGVIKDKKFIKKGDII